MSKQCPNCQRSISCPWCDGTIKALDEARARAKLVPDLLHVCRLAWNLVANHMQGAKPSVPPLGDLAELMDEAESAIAKAEGTPAT